MAQLLRVGQLLLAVLVLGQVPQQELAARPQLQALPQGLEPQGLLALVAQPSAPHQRCTAR